MIEVLLGLLSGFSMIATLGFINGWDRNLWYDGTLPEDFRRPSLFRDGIGTGALVLLVAASAFPVIGCIVPVVGAIICKGRFSLNFKD